MKFEEVINALRSGQKIRCKEWANKGRYITKELRGSIDISSICSDNWEIIPEKVKPKLTEKERIILAGLRAMGYKWIAHNENEEYDVAFTKKPYKYKTPKGIYWFCDVSCFELDFYDVAINLHIAKCSDDEPLSIDWLLESR